MIAVAVDAFVNESFKGYEHQKILFPKAIHDSVHATNYFQPHEVAILDLPIVQRLRRISQTDVAYYVFPSANHNRFEHTIGVAAIAGRFVDALFQRNSKALQSAEMSLKYVKNHCRVAALLHDVGHGPFSHLTEQLYKSAFKKLQQSNEKFGGASAHEILSYFIATSKRMRQFNEEIIKREYEIDIDLELIGKIIIGFSKDIPKQAFMVEIINGAFDADKLDYMLRDSHSTGINMSLDLSRLLYTIDVLEYDNRIPLSIDNSGAIALEQIVFNKMTLNTTIYHHHKVRATGCMIKNIFENRQVHQTPSSFLDCCDDDIWTQKDDRCATLLNNLKNRRLPKRALVIAAKTIEHGFDRFYEMLRLAEDDTIGQNLNTDIEFSPKMDLQTLLTAIQERVQQEYGIDVDGKIWIDVPSSPKFKEAITCIIKNSSTARPILTLKDIFPIDDWTNAFTQNKWCAYVFSMPECRKQVSEVSKSVFEECFDIRFNEYAQSICKID